MVDNPVNDNQAPPKSRAEQLPDYPYLVFDVRNATGHMGIFQSERQAQEYINSHHEGGYLDYGTPRQIEQWNPSGPETDEYTAYSLDKRIREALHTFKEKNPGLTHQSRKVALMKTPNGLEEVRYRVLGPATLDSRPDLRNVLHRRRREEPGWEKPFYYEPPGHFPSVHKDRDSVRYSMENHQSFVKWKSENE